MNIVPSTPLQWSQQSNLFTQNAPGSTNPYMGGTPLVMGTPRSPLRNLPMASPSMVNNFQVPRGDMGRSNHRIVFGARNSGDRDSMPPTPATM
jgi:hypothetical protein